MSEENVRIAQEAFDAYNAHDFERYRRLLDRDVIMRAPENWLEPGPFVGADAVVREFEHMTEPFDDDAVEPITEFIAVTDRVLVRLAWRTVGGHGPPSNMEMTCAYTIRKGKILGIEYFWDHAEALATLGLSE